MTQNSDSEQKSAAAGSGRKLKGVRLIIVPLMSGALLALSVFGVFFSSGGGWDFRFDGMNFLPWAGVAFIVGIVLGFGLSAGLGTSSGRRAGRLGLLIICGILWLLFFCGTSVLIISTFWI